MLERAKNEWAQFERLMLDSAGDDVFGDELNELLDVLPTIQGQISRRAERSAKRAKLNSDLAKFFDAKFYPDENNALIALKTFRKLGSVALPDRPRPVVSLSYPCRIPASGSQSCALCCVVASLPEAPSGELKVMDAAVGSAYALQHIVISKALQNPKWTEILPQLETRTNRKLDRSLVLLSCHSN